MKIAGNIGLLLQCLIGFNLIFPVVLLLIYNIKQSVKKSLKVTPLPVSPDYAIIVTAYEQTQQLNAVVDSLLKLRYTNYHIYIVADKCDISNLRFPEKVFYCFVLSKPWEVTQDHIFMRSKTLSGHIPISLLLTVIIWLKVTTSMS